MKHAPTNQAGRRTTLAHWLWVVNVAALLGVAVFFRVWRIDHVPGVNGDEAWLGVQALAWLDGKPVEWTTPTGNPINPFYFLPLAALHVWLPPSIALLRLPAVVSTVRAATPSWPTFSRSKRTAARP